MNQKIRCLKISDMCNIVKGDAKYNKVYVCGHRGEYPLFSSQTTNDGVFGFINSFDYDVPCITWTTDGIYAGTVFMRNCRFSMTSHCGALFLKDEYVGVISLDYLYVWLSYNLKSHAISEGNKRVTYNVIKNIKVPFFEDIKQQDIVVKKFNFIKDIRCEISTKYKNICDVSIDFLSSDFLKMNYVKLSNIADFPTINGVTISFINSHKGDVPVYGGRADGEPLGYIEGNLQEVKYFSNCLSYNRNGSIGNVFNREHKFTVTDDHRPIVIKKNYKSFINSDYMCIAISLAIKLAGFDYTDKAGKDKLMKLDIGIPVMSGGEFDIRTQLEILLKYKKIIEVRNFISDEYNRIIEGSVDVGLPI